MMRPNWRGVLPLLGALAAAVATPFRRRRVVPPAPFDKTLPRPARKIRRRVKASKVHGYWKAKRRRAMAKASRRANRGLPKRRAR